MEAVGPAGRRPADRGTRRGSPLPARPGSNRTVPATGYEQHSDVQLFRKYRDTLNTISQAQGRLTLIRREMNRRNRKRS